MVLPGRDVSKFHSNLGSIHKRGLCAIFKDEMFIMLVACVVIGTIIIMIVTIRSSDNDSTGFWPPGLLHTRGADGHI